MDQETSKLLIGFRKRAEKIDTSSLVDSFVDIGPLFTVLSSVDNQVFYGRRGTGKTHVLAYLSNHIRLQNEIAVYLDLRNIGSSGGIYSDGNIPVTERGTRLLLDTLGAIHDELINESLSDETDVDLSQVGPVLDTLAEAISKVSVIGDIEEEVLKKEQLYDENKSTVALSASPKGISGNIDFNNSEGNSTETTKSTKQTGQLRHRVHFGEVGKVFRNISEKMNNKRIWLLLDEWSSIPIDLQPILADLIRRSIFPAKNITVKIAAIEKRSNFQIKEKNGDYIGIELGGDASADLNLDDYMVFDNDELKSIEFFKELLYRHYLSLLKSENSNHPSAENSDVLISNIFTRIDVFREFVRSSEGIPRDAFSILSLAAQKDFASKISMNTIRIASKMWYQRDKESAVSSNHEALSLLHWIIDRVISHRRARAFLLERSIENKVIDELFDSRVLHLLKRNISAHDSPGRRYDVYKIDYGCYVDLLSTAKSPQGLFETDLGNYAEVPQDDYRSIRRAILDISEFKKRPSG